MSDFELKSARFCLRPFYALLDKVLDSESGRVIVNMCPFKILPRASFEKCE